MQEYASVYWRGEDRGERHSCTSSSLQTDLKCKEHSKMVGNSGKSARIQQTNSLVPLPFCPLKYESLLGRVWEHDLCSKMLSHFIFSCFATCKGVLISCFCLWNTFNASYTVNLQCKLTVFFFCLKYNSSRYQQKKSPENKNGVKNYKPSIQPYHGLWWL